MYLCFCIAVWIPCLSVTPVVHTEFNFSTYMWHTSVTLLKVVVTIIFSCTITLLCIMFFMLIIYLAYAEIILYFTYKWHYCFEAVYTTEHCWMLWYLTYCSAVVLSLQKPVTRLNRIKIRYKCCSTFWSRLTCESKVNRSAMPSLVNRIKYRNHWQD